MFIVRDDQDQAGRCTEALESEGLNEHDNGRGTGNVEDGSKQEHWLALLGLHHQPGLAESVGKPRGAPTMRRQHRHIP
jgi:hypothetical protein